MTQAGEGANFLPPRLLPRLHEVLGNRDRTVQGLIQHQSARNVLEELDRALTRYHEARGRRYIAPHRNFGREPYVELPPWQEGLDARLDLIFHANDYIPPTRGGLLTRTIQKDYQRAAVLTGARDESQARQRGDMFRLGGYDPFAVGIVTSSARLTRFLHYYVLSNENMIVARTSVVSFLSLLDVDEGAGVESIGTRLTRGDASLRSTVEFLQGSLQQVRRDINRASRLLRRAASSYPSLLAIFLDMQNASLLARVGVLLRILANCNIQMEMRVVIGRRRKTWQGQRTVATIYPREVLDEVLRLERHVIAGEEVFPSAGVFNTFEDYVAARNQYFTTAGERNDGMLPRTLEEALAIDGVIDEVNVRTLRIVVESFSIVDLKTRIRTALAQIFQRGGEYYDNDYDALIVESVAFTEVPSNNLQLTRQTPYLPDLVNRYLQELRAFRNGSDVLRATGKLQLPCIPFTGAERECVMEAFFSMRILQKPHHGWDFKPYGERRAELQTSIAEFKKDFGEVLAGMSVGTMSLYRWLDLLLGSELSETMTEPGVMVAMYSGMGRPLFCPMMWIRMVELRLVIDFPKEGETFQEDEFPDGQLMLVYYKAHLFVSTLGQVRSSLQMPGSSKQRVRDLGESGFAQPYLLQAKSVVDGQHAASKREARRLKSVSKGGPDATIQGSYDAFTGIDNLSYDLETDNCERCSKLQGKQVQHAYVMSFVGVEARTFAGVECELDYGSCGGGMAQYTGCISQALTYMKNTMGFHLVEGDRRPSRAVITRMLWAFNGAAFDAHFILKALNGWRQPVKVIEMSGELICVSVFNYKFVDFRKIYDGSLDKVYKSFVTLEGAEANRPPESKLKCFPYGLIHRHMSNEWVTGLDLRKEEIWGGRRATVFNEETKTDEPYRPDLPLGEANAVWWEEHMDERGYRSQQLLYYCELDTKILQWCVNLHVQVLCKGELQGRPYNLNGTITGPGGALRLMEQCFLPEGEGFTAPPQDLRLAGLYEEASGKEILLSSVLRTAMKGGLVDVYCTHMHDPARMQAWKDLKDTEGIEHTVVGLDVNSMYPYIMATAELPVVYDGVESHLETPIIMEGQDEGLQGGLQDSNLYLCSILHGGEGTTMIRVGGYCFCPNYIPMSWQDHDRTKDGRPTTEYNFVYGVELKGVLSRGGRVIIHYQIKFKTSAVVMDFVKEIYARRVASKTKMMNLFWKKMLNSLYGKFGQEVKEECHILENLLDVIPLLSEHRVLTGFTFLECANDGYDRVLVKILDVTKPVIGQFCAVAGRITAGAREYLRTLQEKMSQLPNEIGLPARLYYGDTDSFYIDAMVPPSKRVPGDATTRFFEEYISETGLGKLKIETAGITEAHFLAKKTYMYAKTVNGLSDQKIKCKGFNNEFVDWMRMLEVGRTVQAAEFACRDGFRHNFRLGIYRKAPNEVKRMSYGNLARQAPGPDGVCKCWPTIEAFLQNKEALKTREQRDMREMIIPAFA